MKTVANIKTRLSRLEAETTYTHAGPVITREAKEQADSYKRHILSFLTEGTAAFDIVSRGGNLTEKQLWLVAYALDKTTYANEVAEVEKELEKKAELKKIKSANKRAERNQANHNDQMRELLKAAGKKEFEYYTWAKANSHVMYSEASVTEFINL